LKGEAFDLSDVHCHFQGFPALGGVSLRINKGERVALAGPSGCGKTTLLRLFSASQASCTGSVRVFGQDAATMGSRELRRHRSNIALIPQNLGLVTSLRTYQNVALGKIGKRRFPSVLRSILFPSKAELRQIHHCLERVGISEKLYQSVATLSGGQQQRTAVARALFQEPQAILADEPVSSVDPARAESIVALLNDLAEEQSLTLAVSLHNIDLARRYFPRIVGMRAGKIIFDKAPKDISDVEFTDLYNLSQTELLDD